MELIAVVMGAETSQMRNAACKQLLDYGFANYALISPELTEAGQVPVTLGKQPGVSPIMGDHSALLVEKGQKSAITTQITLEPSLPAPVSQGQRIGTLTMKAGEQVLKEVPLVAAEGVERLNWGDIFVTVLKRAAMAKN